MSLRDKCLCKNKEHMVNSLSRQQEKVYHFHVYNEICLLLGLLLLLLFCFVFVWRVFGVFLFVCLGLFGGVFVCLFLSFFLSFFVFFRILLVTLSNVYKLEAEKQHRAPNT